MLLALTAGQKAGLVAAAAVFIVFALVSSFLLPRRNPDFPGRKGLPLFVLASVLLFVGMMSAMALLAVEDEEAGAGVEHAQSESAPGGGGETGGGASGGGQAQGDPEAGAAVFASAGCGSCHVLEAAGSSGTIGPSLDESQPSFELAVDRVTNGQGAMPAFEGQLTEEQIRDVAAYVVASTSK